MLPADSPRNPATASLFFSLPASASFFGCSGLANEGEAFSRTRVKASDCFRALSPALPRRLRGSASSSSRSMARGFPAIMRSSPHQAIAAKVPNSASGTRLSKLMRLSARITSLLPRDHGSRFLDLDVDDFADYQRSDDLHDDCHGEHFGAHRIAEQHHDVIGIQFVDGDEQHKGQG